VAVEEAPAEVILDSLEGDGGEEIAQAGLGARVSAT